jgi:diaminohydroxyphosphoribosylaminopyrimidine deaminase/5-amino-6-(5-phosphoribosylamino)uracil reductase
MVGCVLVSPDKKIVGWGYHAVYGGLHAEIEALKRAGTKARGCTAYVTLEPCCHVGKTGPCTDQLINAGVSKVVIARKDPSIKAGNGSALLRAAGIEVVLDKSCKEAIEVSDPFIFNQLHQMPWIIAKWAQSIDGLIAPASGNSRWITGYKSRMAVHRLRAKVDAIITAIGTVQKDDPLLTARSITRPRRLAKRVVIDPRLEISMHSRLINSADQSPLFIYCLEEHALRLKDKIKELSNKGVSVFGLKGENGRFKLQEILTDLFLKGVSTAMVEAGGGLLDGLFSENLINEAWVFAAPILIGSKGARAVLPAKVSQSLEDSIRLELRQIKVIERDILMKFRLPKV